MVVNVREACSSDVERILGLDEIARRDLDRASFLRGVVENRRCFVADRAGRVLGYGVLEYTFFGHGFISLLYVDAQSRRQGIGLDLIRDLERRCKTRKLFTSTNDSNEPMKALLVRSGFKPSGIIHNLDPGDPEIVYFKQKETSAA